MPRPSLIVRPFAVLLLAAAAAGAAFAQEGDLPGRVGRLADVGGRVYIATEQRAEDWLDARRNDTVTSGDNLWVAGGGRAEIDYGGGQFRLAGDTNVHVARLDDTVLALFVAQGRVIVRVRVLEPGEVARIDTPNTQLALTRPGLYRVDVTEDRTRTELVVREGEATASFATGLQQVLPGQTALLEGEEPAFAGVRNGFYLDGFDTWSADRDRYYERARSANYVSRQMIGYADLDGYGHWETVPEYGALWYPTGVAVDWAPYRYGRWSWVGGWGWTWVDDAPWGYAPFHYGRWVHYGGRWGWAPGGYVARPLWAPALVGWYGGAGWSFSVSFGAPVYGWVPLAWGEPYVPWWGGCSHRCWTMYNRPYAVNLAERPGAPPTRYTNWSAPGGVTAVADAVFTGRRPVHGNLVNVRPQAVTSAPVLAYAPRVDKPAPGKVPGVRPPASAPLPAAAFQTKPMRLPATAGPAAAPQTWSGGAGPAPRSVAPGRPSAAGPGGGGPTAAPPAPSAARPSAGAPVGPGVRAPARAPSTPGTWGATGERAPRGATPAAAPRPPVSAVPPSSAGEGRGALQREPRPAQTWGGSSPSVAPQGPRAPTPPSAGPAGVPRSAPPSAPAAPAVVPRSAPPSAPSAPAVVPRSAPPSAPAAPAVVPRSAPPPSVDRGRAPASSAGESGARGEPPAGRPMPKEMQR